LWHPEEVLGLFKSMRHIPLIRSNGAERSKCVQSVDASVNALGTPVRHCGHIDDGLGEVQYCDKILKAATYLHSKEMWGQQHVVKSADIAKSM